MDTKEMIVQALEEGSEPEVGNKAVESAANTPADSSSDVEGTGGLADGFNSRSLGSAKAKGGAKKAAAKASKGGAKKAVAKKAAAKKAKAPAKAAASKAEGLLVRGARAIGGGIGAAIGKVGSLIPGGGKAAPAAKKAVAKAGAAKKSAAKAGGAKKAATKKAAAKATSPSAQKKSGAKKASAKKASAKASKK